MDRYEHKHKNKIQRIFSSFLKFNVVLTSTYSVITMCFYGLSFNSGKQDLFKGTGLMAGVEVLAYFIILFTIDIGGRRPGGCNNF